MPKDESRYPGKFPAWMQLCYAKALKTPGEWVDCIVLYSNTATISEMRGFRAFRRSIRDPRWETWAKTLRPDAQEFSSRSRMIKEDVIENNWPKVKHTIQLICFKGAPPEILKKQREDGLKKLGGDLGLGEGNSLPDLGK